MAQRNSFIRLNKDEIQYILDNVNKASLTEMSEWIGCTKEAVRYHIKKHKIKTEQFSMWSAFRKAELVELRKGGMSIKALAERYKVSQKAISGQLCLLRKNGIEIPYYVKKEKNGRA